MWFRLIPNSENYAVQNCLSRKIGAEHAFESLNPPIGPDQRLCPRLALKSRRKYFAYSSLNCYNG